MSQSCLHVVFKILENFITTAQKVREALFMDPATIYEDLKEKIIWLEIEPGRTLNLTELAKSYGVSRNPVMIALTRLNAEEWVVRNGVHFVVSPLTIDRMRELTEIRAVLEIQANIWAMNRMTPQELDDLKQLKKEILALDDATPNKVMVELDDRFHCLLFRGVKNSYLSQMLERLLCHFSRFCLFLPREMSPKVFFAEALEIIAAIEAKDEARLRMATLAHIKETVDEIFGCLLETNTDL